MGNGKDDLSTNTNKIGNGNRYSNGKVQPGRVSPYLQLGAAEVMTWASQKYPDKPNGESNWQQGLDFQGIINCLDRHWLDFKLGIDKDEDSCLHSLKHMACNLGFLMHFIATGQDKDLDNRMFKNTPKKED